MIDFNVISTFIIDGRGDLLIYLTLVSRREDVGGTDRLKDEMSVRK